MLNYYRLICSYVLCICLTNVAFLILYRYYSKLIHTVVYTGFFVQKIFQSKILTLQKISF